jgi:hypothetical protein
MRLRLNFLKIKFKLDQNKNILNYIQDKTFYFYSIFLIVALYDKFR